MGGLTRAEGEQYKYLGVNFQNRLDWGEHVKRVANKAIRRLNFVMRQLRGMGKEVKNKAYLTVIRPIVEYGASVWDPYRIGVIKKIEKVQRIAARRVTGRMRRWRYSRNSKGVMEKKLESPTEMILEMRWQSLEGRRRVDRLTNFFRARQGKGGWEELCGKIEKDESGFMGRDRHREHVVVKKMKTYFGKHSFLTRTGQEWNKLTKVVFEGGEITANLFRKRLSNQTFLVS